MQTTVSNAVAARKQGRTANVNLAAIAAKSLNRYCPMAAAILAPWAFIECAGGDPSPVLVTAAVAVTVAPLYLKSNK